MKSWFAVLKQALTLRASIDALADAQGAGRLRDNLKRLTPSLRKYWRVGAVSASLTILSAFISLPQPLVSRQLIDKVILDRQLGYLPLVLALTAGIGLSSLLLGILKEWYATRFEQQVNLDLQERLYAHVLKLPKAFFEARDTGYLIGRITGDVGGLRWFYSRTLISVAVQSLQFFGGLIMLFVLDWYLTLLVLTLLPLARAATYFLGRRVHDLAQALMEEQARSQGTVAESLSSVALIKSHTAEKRTLRQMVSVIKKSADMQLQQSVLNQLSRIGTNLGPAVASLAVLCVGAYWVVKGKWTLGSLAAFQSYMGHLLGPPQSIAGMSLPFQNARVALERVNRFFKLVPEENYDTGKRIERLTGAVEFRNVSFSYNGSAPVVEKLDLRIQRGEHVAIVGPSGIGKTTLISLILRFYRPTSGEIFFDGEPASAYEVQSLRRRIGYVAQTPVLLSLSILENLRYGNPEATMEEVRWVCRIAGIDAFVEALPQGFHTIVGPRGLNLSEGQSQRLSLARALVKEPDILLFDEPTSAIDLVTERSIFESLPSVIRGKTLFIVAHRLSTIKDCSKIILLDENRLVACGTHEMLLRTNEYYRLLIQIQRASSVINAESAGEGRFDTAGDLDLKLLEAASGR